MYIPVITSAPGFNRQQFGINYPYLLPKERICPTRFRPSTVPQFLQPGRRPVSVALHRPDLHRVRQRDKGVGQSHHQGGFYFEHSGENDGDQINVSTVPGGSNNQNGTFLFSDREPDWAPRPASASPTWRWDSPTATPKSVPAPRPIYRGYLYEWFAQDSWKVNVETARRLRRPPDHHGAYKALWGNQVFFDPALYNPSQAPQVDPNDGQRDLGTGNPYNGMVIPGSAWPSDALRSWRDPGLRRGIVQQLVPRTSPNYYATRSIQFQPRLGIAYQLNEKTVIRAGIGEFRHPHAAARQYFPRCQFAVPALRDGEQRVGGQSGRLAERRGTARPITVTTLARDN